MVLEDVHWADPTSLEVSFRAVDQIRTLRVLLLTTFRPEFDAPWVGRPYVTALIINQLAEHEVGAMIDRIVGNRLPSASIRQDIIERTDGIPLFVEEKPKAVVERGARRPPCARLPQFRLPALGSPRPACSLWRGLIGSAARPSSWHRSRRRSAASFRIPLLAAVVRQPEAELDIGIGPSHRGRFAVRRGVPPHATYLFKHPLVRDAAYARCCASRAARCMPASPNIAREIRGTRRARPELLARHWTEAGLIEKAAGL